MNATDTVTSRTGFHFGAPSVDPVAEARRAAERVCGPTFGIVRSCREMPLPPGTAFRVFVAQGARRGPAWRMRRPPDGTGMATEAEPARLAAIAEVVERYAAMAPPDPGLLVTGAARDLGPPAVDPRSFALLSERQYRTLRGARPLDADRVVEWHPAFSLSRGEPVLVPAALVYHHVAARPGNDFLPELGTTGVACHVCLHRAVLAALCEVLERDALAIAWHQRLPLTRLDPADTVVGALLDDGLGRFGRFELFSVPSDAPFPVILAVAWNPERPRAAVGGACRPHAAEAAVKAVAEAFQTVLRTRARPAATPAAVREFDDHALFYADGAGSALLRRHLVAGPTVQPLATVPSPRAADTAEYLRTGLSSLAENGLDVIVADLTPGDVARAGFRVVKVVVPGMLDISADPRFARLGSLRLYELPGRLGMAGATRESELNLLPIPLA